MKKPIAATIYFREVKSERSVKWEKKNPSCKKTSDLPRMWSWFLFPHEPPANVKSRKNSYSKRNDSKVIKTIHTFPAILLLGMYILMHIENDEHTEVFTDSLCKQKVGSCSNDNTRGLVPEILIC